MKLQVGGAKPPGVSMVSRQNQVKEPEKKQAVDADDKKAEGEKKEAEVRNSVFWSRKSSIFEL